MLPQLNRAFRSVLCLPSSLRSPPSLPPSFSSPQVLSQLNRAGMPVGVERAIAFRATSLAHTAAPLVAALVTTRLGARFGWQTVCKVYAVR